MIHRRKITKLQKKSYETGFIKKVACKFCFKILIIIIDPVKVLITF